MFTFLFGSILEKNFWNFVIFYDESTYCFKVEYIVNKTNKGEFVYKTSYFTDKLALVEFIEDLFEDDCTCRDLLIEFNSESSVIISVIEKDIIKYDQIQKRFLKMNEDEYCIFMTFESFLDSFEEKIPYKLFHDLYKAGILVYKN
jgi:hypothetical protein